MAIEITHIRFGGTKKTEDEIVSYKWKSLSDGDTGQSSKATLVDWIDNKNGTAYVGSGNSRVNVGVVKPQYADPYLRTYADGKWNNNLLSLPTF